MFFSFSGQTIARKFFLKKGGKKLVYATFRFQEFIFIMATPEITAKPAEKLQCKGDWGVGWGQGEIVCEQYWLKSLIKWKIKKWMYCLY